MPDPSRRTATPRRRRRAVGPVGSVPTEEPVLELPADGAEPPPAEDDDERLLREVPPHHG